jgi:hypothetical protein
MKPSALWVGILAALLFLGFTAIQLDRQGLYYDEVHSAVASFAYMGKEPQMFTPVIIGGVPVLVLPYSGALKPALYGTYLQFSGSFSVVSWRLLGLLIVSLGIFLFCVLGGAGLSSRGLLLFLFLFLTDATVLTTSRHDWGPVAISLFLRLLFIALFLRGSTRESSSPWCTFSLGIVVGLSVYEKLNNAVLVVPLIIFRGCYQLRRADQGIRSQLHLPCRLVHSPDSAI